MTRSDFSASRSRDGDERLIVITLHIGLDPKHAIGTGELAGQVERHQPGHAGGVAGVRLDRFASSVVASALDRRGLKATPAVAAA